MTNQPDSLRTPAFLREHGNRLANEPSLYLRQHAHNPLDWFPWGEEALEKAKREDKIIFLSIGYSSCHWCHVMEHEVFEHDDVAEFMNQHFICIKVDREERPDLDKVYMDAVQMMTGRGGWPMSVFLTPDAKPFHGGTYFPKKPFMELALRITEVYRDNRQGLEQQAGQVAERIASGPGGMLGLPDGTAGEISNGFLGSAVASAVDRAKQNFDPTHGGSLQQQKFPTPAKWRFLLHEYRRAGDAELAEMVAKTCEAMAQGGIYDHVGGGFHRYTVDEDWTVPHFEKMLYDNGQLASLLFEAGVVLDRPDFIDTARDLLDFLLRDMRSKEGGFYASYDADSGGEEGTYYVWSRADLAAVAGEEDGPVLADLLGVSAEGNFEHTGKSVLTRRADRQKIADRYDRSLEELDGLFAKYRDQLQSRRDDRTPPGLDQKVVASWNALTISALAQGYAVTDSEDYLDGARQAADFLLAKHRDEDGFLMRASTGNDLRGRGILDDYSFLADALMDLFQVSAETKYLAAARELIDLAIVEFGRDGGSYFLSDRSVDAPLGRPMDAFDSVEPSGAAVMVGSLIKLSALTGETKYRDRAVKDIESQAVLLERASLELAWWLDASFRLTHPYYDVVIAGDPKDAKTLELTHALLKTLPPSAVLTRVPAQGADRKLLAIAPALEGKTAPGDQATVYVCEFGTCQAPTSDPAKMQQQILEGWVK